MKEAKYHDYDSDFDEQYEEEEKKYREINTEEEPQAENVEEESKTEDIEKENRIREMLEKWAEEDKKEESAEYAVNVQPDAHRIAAESIIRKVAELCEKNHIDVGKVETERGPAISLKDENQCGLFLGPNQYGSPVFEKAVFLMDHNNANLHSQEYLESRDLSNAYLYERKAWDTIAEKIFLKFAQENDLLKSGEFHDENAIRPDFYRNYSFIGLYEEYSDEKYAENCAKNVEYFQKRSEKSAECAVKANSLYLASMLKNRKTDAETVEKVIDTVTENVKEPVKSKECEDKQFSTVMAAYIMTTKQFFCDIKNIASDNLKKHIKDFEDYCIRKANVSADRLNDFIEKEEKCFAWVKEEIEIKKAKIYYAVTEKKIEDFSTKMIKKARKLQQIEEKMNGKMNEIKDVIEKAFDDAVADRDKNVERLSYELKEKQNTIKNQTKKEYEEWEITKWYNAHDMNVSENELTFAPSSKLVEAWDNAKEEYRKAVEKENGELKDFEKELIDIENRSYETIRNRFVPKLEKWKSRIEEISEKRNELIERMPEGYVPSYSGPDR